MTSCGTDCPQLPEVSKRAEGAPYPAGSDSAKVIENFTLGACCHWHGHVQCCNSETVAVLQMHSQQTWHNKMRSFSPTKLKVGNQQKTRLQQAQEQEVAHKDKYTEGLHTLVSSAPYI